MMLMYLSCFPFRDRVGPIWQTVRDHIYNLAVNANEHTFLAERAVVGLIRLAIRLLRREEIAAQVRHRQGGSNCRIVATEALKYVTQ